MLLSNCNIQELVLEQASAYLIANQLSFNELKAILLQKSPINNIHSEIIKKLTQSKIENQNAIKKNLQTQAYKKQDTEDSIQAKNDEAQQIQDNITLSNIQRELDHIPTLISNHETEIKILNCKPKHGSDSDRNLGMISMHQIAINTSKKSIKDLQTQMQELERRIALRTQRQNALNHRKQARANYQDNNQNLEQTLCPSSQIDLAKNIQDQLLALDLQFEALINDAYTINYGIFFELITDNIDKNTLNFNKHEQQALKELTRLIHLHLNLEHKATSINHRLQQKKQGLLTLDAKLIDYKNKHDRTNEQIERTRDESLNFELNNHAATSLQKREQQRNKQFSKPVLSLTILMLLSTIPLILFLTSIIPVFLPPFFAFLILAIPPLALFAATMTCGVLSLIYGSKAQNQEYEIKLNTQSINANSSHIKSLMQELTLLENQILSQTEIINKENVIKSALEQELEENQIKAEQAFTQAKAIIAKDIPQQPVLVSKQSHDYAAKPQWTPILFPPPQQMPTPPSPSPTPSDDVFEDALTF